MSKFPVFDSDSHVVEPPALWEKYLDPDYRVLGQRALWRHDGETNSYLKINGEVVRDTMNPNIPRHAIWRPGMTWDDVGALDAKTRHAANPGASEPRARLADMDKMGVDQAFLYPTWFAEGFPLVTDPDTANALARAYNDWIADFCAADPRRLFAAAVLPLQDMDLALAELRRVAKNPSFRGAFIRPMFVGDSYFTSPYFDPLWAELEKLGLIAAVHPTAGLWNPEWTSHGPFVEKVKNRSGQTPLPAGGAGPFSGGGAGLASTSFFTAFPQLGHPMAPILSGWLDNHMFAASVLIGFTVMQRFPGMKVVLAHGKASWMEEVLEKMEASSRVIPLLHKYPVRTDTEEMWEEGNVMLGFDAEERFIQKMPRDFAEKVVWGSRYPQHDTTSAHDAIAMLADAGVPGEIVAAMMGGNAARQFGVKLMEMVADEAALAFIDATPSRPPLAAAPEMLISCDMKKRDLSSPFALPIMMARLTAASWETIFHRGVMMAQGTCSAGEDQRMAMEKAAAAQSAMLALMAGKAPTAVMSPYVTRARANAKRLRRKA